MKRFFKANAAMGAAAAIAATLTLATTHIARAAGLTVGDMAPPIVVKQFVKGAPVAKLPKGKVSVVEFWATWCGPCRESIPHLTEMAKKYPQVTFVGVSVWENDQKLVAPFVKQMGAKMDYHVAMDKVPAGANGSNGTMAKTWMTAAGQDGIPTAFVIGPDGRIDWIGHPMEMEEPLAKITAGHWNVATAAAEMKKKQAQEAQMMALQTELQKAAATKDPKKMLAVIDAAFAKDPSLEGSQLGLIKFGMLRETGTKAEAQTYGTHLVEVAYKDNAEALNALAWPLVDPAKGKPDAETGALALQAAKRADTLTQGKEGAIADTLAAALYATGDSAGAAAAETRAIKLIGPNGDGVAEMKDHLTLYQGGAPAK